MPNQTGPACGNNPNYRMSDGDRQAVEAFKAYLADRAALRDRIAEALYAHDHPSRLVPLAETGMEPAYRESADAVLAVLPPADRAAILRAAADEAERLMDERNCLDFLDGVDWTLTELRRMAAEAQPSEPLTVDRATVDRALDALRAGNHITARLLLGAAMDPAKAQQDGAAS
jgi:hypothetical protein